MSAVWVAGRYFTLFATGGGCSFNRCAGGISRQWRLVFRETQKCSSETILSNTNFRRKLVFDRFCRSVEIGQDRVVQRLDLELERSVARGAAFYGVNVQRVRARNAANLDAHLIHGKANLVQNGGISAI